ncbi:MAG TPA: sodium/solute symporter [Vicinamibacterales bacterium]|nr:sodium/solute symporter [Vicinamibacterales bacterium]
MSAIDIVVFVTFIATVIGVGLYKSRGEATHGEHGASDYFLAGRGLSWWLIGFSLIAANISTEQFVGMSGQAANWLGIAIASYEWMAAITLVVVAFVFLPTFLRSGIYTMPEFLEYRFNPFARTIMAVSTMIILVGVPTASVIYSGAKVISVYFAGMTLVGLDLGNIAVGCWVIGIVSAVYVFAGGLKACAWADLLQGTALIAGGAVVMVLALRALGAADPAALVSTAVVPGLDPAQLADAGAWERIRLLNGGALPEGKLHMVRPASDPSIPWTALVVGLWIPNFFYWGLNQYITQRTLGARTLNEGQRGIVFAAFLKLVIPFIVVFPGIMAFNLFNADMRQLGADKNRPALEAFARSEALVYAFDSQFAAIDPETARAMLAANAAALGTTADAATGPAAVAAANDRLVASAQAAGRPVSSRLVGYDHDAAFPLLLKLLPRNGLLGFVLVALFGAVISSLAAMLNAASTIASMDIYRKVRKGASQYELVTAGRAFIVVFVLIAILIAPQLGRPEFGGIFTFIQEFQGFISPGILAIFVFGLLVHRAPRVCGTVGLLLNPVLYGALKLMAPQVAFLDRMAICFAIVLAVLGVITLLKPMARPVELPVNASMDMRVDRSTKLFGGVVVALTLLLYVAFW